MKHFCDNKKLLVVQPIIAEYRIPVFSEMAKKWEVVVAAGVAPMSDGFGIDSEREDYNFSFVNAPQVKLFSGKLLWQKSLLKLIFNFRPGIIFISANPRLINLWIFLVLCKLFGIKVYCHGQGAYSKKNLKFLQKVMYSSLVKLSHGYICYTQSVYNSLADFVAVDKLTVAENSIEIDPRNVIEIDSQGKFGVLFVGRLRSESNLLVLIDAVESARLECNLDIVLHIVGGGDSEAQILDYVLKKSWVKFYGACYDSEVICRIARECSIGCYPGNAGLSVVHYMAMGLVPIVHNDSFLHMGPEPSYIINNVNGRTFCVSDGSLGIKKILCELFGDSRLLYSLRVASKNTYDRLSTPSLGERICNIISD